MNLYWGVFVKNGEADMDQKKFQDIKSDTEKFEYTSMNYTDFEEVEQYELLIHSEKLILLFGHNEERGFFEYHWAGNTAEELLSAMDKSRKDILVSFVPKEWVEDFRQAGFRVYAVYHDYFNPDIRNIGDAGVPEFLEDKDCEEASGVTMSCYEQSRGFHGETAEWMKSWINNRDHAAGETGAKHCAVIIYREDNQIVGIVCTAVYAYESAKGPVAWIREVAVRPEYQNRGIAGRLILQALNYGKERGAVRAFLMADECNGQAIHLYEKLGFIADMEEGQIDMLLTNEAEVL